MSSKTRVCPYCFELFDVSDVKFRCGNPSCSKSKDEALSNFWQLDHIESPVAPAKKKFLGGVPELGVCPECHREAYQVICPHCHNRLPSNMVKDGGFIVSIVGARSSGKTNYITVLINELLRNGYRLGNIGTIPSSVSDTPQNSTTNRYKNDFYEFVYGRSECPPQTATDDPKSKVPLIYELTQKGTNSAHLVFYDTAGENFNSPEEIENNARFLKNSDAVIYLLDTFNIEQVHQRLQQPMNLGNIELPYDFILNNIIGFFDNRTSKQDREAFYKKPIALTFSKIDAILNNTDLFDNYSIPGMSMNQNSPYMSGSSVLNSDFDGINEGLRQAMAMWGEGTFLNNIDNRFKNAHFFGISALGEAPEKATQISNLQPYRVLDPLVWILLQLKYQFK